MKIKTTAKSRHTNLTKQAAKWSDYIAPRIVGDRFLSIPLSLYILNERGSLRLITVPADKSSIYVAAAASSHAAARSTMSCCHMSQICDVTSEWRCPHLTLPPPALVHAPFSAPFLEFIKPRWRCAATHWHLDNLRCFNIQIIMLQVADAAVAAAAPHPAPHLR